VELRHLHSFLAVAEEGGISAAARRLGMTQPALSRQIKALEDELGVVLLDRGARSFVLTPAAELLWEEGGRLSQSWDWLIERVRSQAVGKPLRIGYSPSLASDILPAAIQSFSQLHPALRISLHELSSLEMLQMLGAGQLEVVVTVPTSSTDPVEWTCLREQRWKLIVSRKNPLAQRKEIRVEELAGHRLLIYDREHYPDYWSRISGYFRAYGLAPRIACEFDGITSLAAAVEADLGLALVAESTRLVRDGARDTVVLDISPQPELIRVSAGVMARYTPPPHVLAFIEELKIVAREENGSV
jgi:LysR family transcriptional regulator, benzoate and cis,cis-muconate-responsive activator of ben and cat genes